MTDSLNFDVRSQADYTLSVGMDGSYVGAYGCGCGDPDPVIEQWTLDVGARVGATVCKRCGRVIALQIQSSGYMNHEILDGDDDD